MKSVVVAFTLFFLTISSVFSQSDPRFSRKTLVVAHAGGCVPVLSGPSGNCKVIGQLMPQASVCQLCEKVDSNGILWAKVEVRGWVTVRKGNQRYLRRLMTRDHEWAVAPGAENCPPVICSCPKGTGIPVCQLQPCSVVFKESSGLPDCGLICVSFQGWVVKRCHQGFHFREG